MTTDLKGRVNQVWIAVGLICAIAAFGLAYYFTRAGATPPKPVIPANGQLVVVARVAIPSGTLITPGMLEVTRIKGVLPINAYSSCQPLVGEACATAAGVAAPKTATQSTTLNYYAVVPIVANTEITASLVAPNKVAQTPSFGSLNLPPGDVALAVTLPNGSVGGYLQAGDRIDIIAKASSGNANFSFEDLLVLAIGPPSTKAAAAASGSVVLQVTRSQALGIQELVATSSIYTVVLRSAADYGHGYIPTTVTPGDNFTQACTVGTTVNPIIQEDLQQAQAAVTAATKTYNLAQRNYTKANSTLQTLSSNSSQQPAAKQLVLSDAATLSQDQFSLIQAQNAVTSDQAVLYCGAKAAQSQSSSSGYGSGSPQMMQSLFGFAIP
ncbi:MAG: Flp pilus assembly protein CpaB [Candidatus Dormibacteria bacterium]